MKTTAFDRDEILTDILCDYLDGTLDKGERAVFSDYLDEHKQEKEFVQKAAIGKKALEYYRKNKHSKAVSC